MQQLTNPSDSSVRVQSSRRRRRDVEISNTYDLRPTAQRLQRQQQPIIPLIPPSPTSVLRSYGFTTFSRWELGSGHYSKVYKAVSNEVNYAVKVIKLKSVGDDFKKKFLPREIAYWGSVKHPNICHLLSQFSYNDYYIFMVMEYCPGGDLLSYIQKNGPLEYPRGKLWLNQLLDALIYLHRRNIAHRDIKAENVLLWNGTVKLSDFGFVCQASEFYSTTYCGSKAYSSPEVLSGIPYNVFKGDVWAFGALCFVSMTNSMPFRENVSSNQKIIDQQKRREYKWPNFVPKDCRDSVDRILTFEQEMRPTAKLIHQFPFFYPQMPCNSTYQFGDLIYPEERIQQTFA